MDLPDQFTDEQVAAARLRLVIDAKLGRHTPAQVRQIAAMPAEVADAEAHRSTPARPHSRTLHRTHAATSRSASPFSTDITAAPRQEDSGSQSAQGDGLTLTKQIASSSPPGYQHIRTEVIENGPPIFKTATLWISSTAENYHKPILMLNTWTQIDDGVGFELRAGASQWVCEDDAIETLQRFLSDMFEDSQLERKQPGV